MQQDLHHALKSDILKQAKVGGCNFTLVRMHWSKSESGIGLHADPTSFTTAGFQRTDFLRLLGFSRAGCAFVPGGQCYSLRTADTLNLEAFAEAFSKAYERMSIA